MARLCLLPLSPQGLGTTCGRALASTPETDQMRILASAGGNGGRVMANGGWDVRPSPRVLRGAK
jgi:hypothetical protein